MGCIYVLWLINDEPWEVESKVFFKNLIIKNHFNRDGGCKQGLAKLYCYRRGKSQGYNEYDVVVWYLLNDWQWSIDTWKDRHDAP